MWPCLGRIHRSCKEDDTLLALSRRGKMGTERCGESFYLLVDWVGFGIGIGSHDVNYNISYFGYVFIYLAKKSFKVSSHSLIEEAV